MKISEIMTPCPYYIAPDTSVEEAIRLMGIHQIRHLPVVGEDGNLLGVLSERNAQVALTMSKDCSPPAAEEICTEEPLVVSETTPVAQVARAMADSKIDCMLVSNEEGALVGIFTTTDACRLIYLILEDESA